MSDHRNGPGPVGDRADDPERRAWLVAHGAPVGQVGDPVVAAGDGLDVAPVGSTALELTRVGFDVVELLTLLGAGLRELHSAPAEGCPFDAGNEALLDRAEHAVAAGTVDRSRFDRAYQRSTPAQLLDIVTSSRPTDPDVSVLVHGAACLEVARVDGGRVVGWSSLARSGLGDAYRDLATMATDLVAVIGPEALGPFIDAYGLEHPDVLRLDWHVMVDQLVR